MNDNSFPVGRVPLDETISMSISKGTAPRAPRSRSMVGTLSPWMHRKKNKELKESAESLPVLPEPPKPIATATTRMTRSSSNADMAIKDSESSEDLSSIVEEALQSRKISPSDIETRFAHLLEHTLMIPVEAREKMIKELNLGQKWTFLAQQEKRARATTIRIKEGKLKTAPEYLVNQLIANPGSEVYRALRVCISTEPVAWLDRFAEKSGIELLLQSIMPLEKRKDKTDETVDIIYEGLLCLISMSHSGDGLSLVLEAMQGDLLKYVVWCLDTRDARTKILIYDFLALLCALDDASYGLVIDALESYRYVKHESVKYLHLVNTLKHDQSEALKTHCLQLVNAIISTPGDLDTRMMTRIQFRRLGINQTISRLAKQLEYDTDFVAQYETYIADEKSDNDELAELAAASGSDFNLASAGSQGTISTTGTGGGIWDAVDRVVAPHSSLVPLCESIARSLASMPLDPEHDNVKWKVAEKLLQQLSKGTDLSIDGEFRVDLALLLEGFSGSVDFAMREQNWIAARAALENQIVTLQEELKVARTKGDVSSSQMSDSQIASELRDARMAVELLKDSAAQGEKQLLAAENRIHALEAELAEKQAANLRVTALELTVQQLQQNALELDGEAKSRERALESQIAELLGRLQVEEAKVKAVEKLSDTSSSTPRDSLTELNQKLQRKDAEQSAHIAQLEIQAAELRQQFNLVVEERDRLLLKLRDQDIKSMADAVRSPAGTIRLMQQLGGQRKLSGESSAGSSPPVIGMMPPPPPPPAGGPPPPPPPPGGNPPPPPPPPGPPGAPPPPGGGPSRGTGPGVAPPNIAKPSVAMKQVNWSKIADFKTKDTIFVDLVKGQESVVLNTRELEKLFRAKAVEMKEEVAAKKKPKPVSLLDPKKTQLINVFLGSHRLTPAVVKEMILSLDPARLTLDMTEALMNVMASDEEMAKVLEYRSKGFVLARLGPPEMLFLSLEDVPIPRERLNAHALRLSFESRLASLRPKTEAVRSACKQLKESTLWKRLLEVVLAVGNFINGKTGRGGAVGIRVESLLKLGDTRSLDTKTSLLHYIIGMLEKSPTDVAVLGFASDLKSVAAASRIDLQALAGEVRTLNDWVVAVSSAFKRVPDKLHPKDRIRDVLNEPAIKKYETLMTSLKNEVQSTQLEWGALARIYGEDEKTVQSHDFFQDVVTFIDQFDGARKFVIAERIKAEEKAAKKAAAAARREREDAAAAARAAAPQTNVVLAALQAGAGEESSIDESNPLLQAKIQAQLLETLEAGEPQLRKKSIVPGGIAPPSSAMLAQLRSGLKSGSAFAEKRQERKKSLRGKLPDEALPAWAQARAKEIDADPSEKAKRQEILRASEDAVKHRRHNPDEGVVAPVPVAVARATAEVAKSSPKNSPQVARKARPAAAAPGVPSTSPPPPPK